MTPLLRDRWKCSWRCNRGSKIVVETEREMFYAIDFSFYLFFLIFSSDFDTYEEHQLTNFQQTRQDLLLAGTSLTLSQDLYLLCIYVPCYIVCVQLNPHRSMCYWSIACTSASFKKVHLLPSDLPSFHKSPYGYIFFSSFLKVDTICRKTLYRSFMF